MADDKNIAIGDEKVKNICIKTFDKVKKWSKIARINHELV
jgi:hypothetical protein